jgi:hypothetical protein
MAENLASAIDPTIETNAEPLARSEGLGTITFCKCGTLSINIQAMSVRLDVAAFVQLIAMCEQAVSALEQMSEHLQQQRTTNALIH